MSLVFPGVIPTHSLLRSSKFFHPLKIPKFLPSFWFSPTPWFFPSCFSCGFSSSPFAPPASRPRRPAAGGPAPQRAAESLAARGGGFDGAVAWSPRSQTGGSSVGECCWVGRADSRAAPPVSQTAGRPPWVPEKGNQEDNQHARIGSVVLQVGLDKMTQPLSSWFPFETGKWVPAQKEKDTALCLDPSLFGKVSRGPEQETVLSPSGAL